jgi:hypothetical protein
MLASPIARVEALPAGLSSEDAEAALKRDGPNDLGPSRPRSRLLEFLRSTLNPLIAPRRAIG